MASGESLGNSCPLSEHEGTRALSSLSSICLLNGRFKSRTPYTSIRFCEGICFWLQSLSIAWIRTRHPRGNFRCYFPILPLTLPIPVQRSQPNLPENPAVGPQNPLLMSLKSVVIAKLL